jgi:hypothetical protein
MYVWYVYFSSSGDVVDGGIWRSVNGGTSWISISNSGITNCGDGYGCGVQQGTYNLELLAMPDGGATDLYAGAINLYKCQISSLNPTCTASPFINLTHVYGCIPVAAPSSRASGSAFSRGDYSDFGQRFWQRSFVLCQ